MMSNDLCSEPTSQGPGGTMGPPAAACTAMLDWSVVFHSSCSALAAAAATLDGPAATRDRSCRAMLLLPPVPMLYMMSVSCMLVFTNRSHSSPDCTVLWLISTP